MPTTENSTKPSLSKKLRSKEAWSVTPARRVHTGTGTSAMPDRTNSVATAPAGDPGSRHACVTFSSELVNVSWLGFLAEIPAALQNRWARLPSSEPEPSD